MSPAVWRNRSKLCENGNYLSLQAPEFFLSWRSEGIGQLQNNSALRQILKEYSEVNTIKALLIMDYDNKLY